MEFLIIIAYSAILAMVGPFVLAKSDHYGKLVPVSIALVAGSALWLILTWVGFSYSSAWNLVHCHAFDAGCWLVWNKVLGCKA